MRNETEQIRVRKKNYEELTLSDDFIFFIVMQNEELCKEMLERILDVEIEKIEYLASEKEIKIAYDGKGIRLDVYVKDDKKTVYNLEMQVADRDNIPKRTRYYQSMIDKNLLRTRQTYDSLNDTMIIFICRFDLFGYGRAKYTFKNMCKEEAGLELGDGATKIFINSKAIVEDAKGKVITQKPKVLHISEKLKNVLRYIETGKVQDEFTKKLEEEVSRVKHDSEWRDVYMLYELNIHDAKEEGKALMGQLCVILSQEGRIDDIKRVAEDSKYREELFEEYGLK